MKIKVIFICFASLLGALYTQVVFSASFNEMALAVPMPVIRFSYQGAAEASSITTRISTKTRGIMGQMTETTMDRFFQGKGKYTKVATHVGGKGIDGLYVRWTKQGNPRVLVAEAKYNTSVLSQTSKKGPQMSEKWILQSLDEKVAQLKKLPQSPSVQKQVTDLEKVRRCVKSGAYTRRVFHSTVRNGRLEINLQDVKEFDKAGRPRTRPRAADKELKGIAGRFWRNTPWGQRLSIPLSDRAFSRATANAKSNALEYYKGLRQTFYQDLKANLSRNGMHEAQIKDIEKAMKNGNIRTSAQLNRAVDNALYSGKGLPKRLQMAGLNPTQSRRIMKMAKIPFAGRPFVVKRLVAYQVALNSITQGASGVLHSVKNYRQTAERLNSAISKMNSKSMKEILKNKEAWKSGFRGAAKTFVVIIMVYETYKVTSFLNEYNRGFHTRTDLYIKVGMGVGGVAGALAGACIGSPLGPVGVIIGGALGAFAGERIGSWVGSSAYSFFYYLEEEEYRQEYIRSLKSYCHV